MIRFGFHSLTLLLAALSLPGTGANAQGATANRFAHSGIFEDQATHQSMFDTSWVVQTSGTTNQLYAVKTVSPWVGWAAGVGGVVRRTTNAGITWEPAGVLGTDIYTMTAVNANIALVGTSPASGAAKLWKTTNGGTTWIVKDSGGIFWDAIHMFDSTNGFAAGDPLGPYQNWVLKKTTDAGETWMTASVLPGGVVPEGGWNNAMMWLDNTTGWFGTNSSKVYRTTDGGATWSGAATNLGNPDCFALWFNAMDKGLIASRTGSMNRSTDGGLTWTTGPVNLPYPVYSLWGLPASTQFWAVAGPSVYYSSDFGGSWSNTPRNGYPGTSALNHFHAVMHGNMPWGWACGASGTIVHFSPVIGDVKERLHDFRDAFVLHQNYPNPFNPSTVLLYELPVRSHVTLKLFDVLGREVALLVDEDQFPGEQSVEVDGSKLASGVYLVWLRAGERVQTLKMLLLR